jgi:hypothetical protein
MSRFANRIRGFALVAVAAVALLTVPAAAKAGGCGGFYQSYCYRPVYVQPCYTPTYCQPTYCQPTYIQPWYSGYCAPVYRSCAPVFSHCH